MIAEIQKSIRRGLKGLESPPPLRVSEWAAQHYYLSAESSYVEKKWEAYPFQPAIMDAMGNDAIEEVNFRKSARVGYTKMVCATVGYFAQHKRRNQALWQPTDDDRDEFVKTEIDTMLRDVPVMVEVFPQHSVNDKRNTLKAKTFLGSMLYLRGGKAAKSYRRISVDVAILDELDGFDLDIEKEGSPDKLAKKRTEGATFPKLITGSTPKLEGFSRIKAREQQCDLLFTFRIPCPHCDELHPLTWNANEKGFGLKWINNDPTTAAHVCPCCGAQYSQAEYLAVWHRGRWVAQDGTWIDGDSKYRNIDGDIIAPPRAVAFFIWTAYSPQATWEGIVREYIAAKAKADAGDKSELKTFTNTTLGETWEEDAESTDADELKNRAEPYPLRTVPRGALVLVAGVDVQSNRFEVVVWGIGRGEEMWVIDYNVIDARPSDEREWVDKLEPYLQTKFRHSSGQFLGIEAVAIDSGGHYTHQCYNYCRTRSRDGVFAVKGDSKQGQPVKARSSLQDVNHAGKVLKRGVRLWLVGTDTAKDTLFGRLGVEKPGPGYVHFSSGLPKEFYDQLTAEVRILVKTAGGDAYRWVKRDQRNEALDCTVYAMFASHALDLHRFTDHMWAKQESIVCPPMGDLFDVVQTSAIETEPQALPAPETEIFPQQPLAQSPAAPPTPPPVRKGSRTSKLA